MRSLLWLCCVACSYDPSGSAINDDAPAPPIDGEPAAIDAPPDAAPIAFCAGPPILDERFTGSALCSPWGSSDEVNSTMTQGNGTLRIVLSASPASGSCTEPNTHAWGGNGVIVEAPTVLTGPTNYTVFQLLGLDRSMGVVNNSLIFSTGNSGQVFATTAYVPAEMRWWRMRPGTNTIIAEYSADAFTWTPFGSQTTAVANMRANLIAGTDGGAPQGAGEFTRFIICP